MATKNNKFNNIFKGISYVANKIVTFMKLGKWYATGRYYVQKNYKAKQFSIVALNETFLTFPLKVLLKYLYNFEIFVL